MNHTKNRKIPETKSRFSRRNFLKAAGLGGVSLAVPAKAHAIGRTHGDEELATLLDIRKCIACGECVRGCTGVNSRKYPEPDKPFPAMYPPRVKAADWSDKRDVDNRLTPYNWLYIQTAEVEYKGELHTIHIPRRCLHCQNPPCANLCPWGSAVKKQNGIVRINSGTCLGGAKCKMVCPWGIPERQTGVGLYLKVLPNFAGNGVMYKCDRCYDRIDQGKLPACIEVCPENVQTIGPRSEMLARARELAEEINGFIYGDTENGGTNTFYVSPVPFELLNENIETGPGRPHLEDVPNMMAKEENLGMAVLLGPLAGIAAGVLKTVNIIKKKKENTHA